MTGVLIWALIMGGLIAIAAIIAYVVVKVIDTPDVSELRRGHDALANRIYQTEREISGIKGQLNMKDGG